MQTHCNWFQMIEQRESSGLKNWKLIQHFYHHFNENFNTSAKLVYQEALERKIDTWKILFLDHLLQRWSLNVPK